ncbi:hypothetical protein ACFFSY_12375 [Paenibacillus aurantiacus]|uniref:Uncharacterized protein n=1 Tax=Paenibacillus aurantiacus TaxID=1936118 RepID=A0ABV5KNB6_9BACL
MSVRPRTQGRAAVLDSRAARLATDGTIGRSGFEQRVREQRLWAPEPMPPRFVEWSTALQLY